MTEQEIIKKALVATRENCEFKKAFIPEGFTCVNIDNFSKELSEILMKQKDEGD
jgi:hypothetical protein